MPSRARSLHAKSRALSPVRSEAFFGSRSHFAQSTGTSVTATKSDMDSEKMTTIESCVKRMLETPVRKSSGMKTAMWVRVDATIADHTSSLPSMAACSCDLPISMCR